MPVTEKMFAFDIEYDNKKEEKQFPGLKKKVNILKTLNLMRENAATVPNLGL